MAVQGIRLAGLWRKTSKTGENYWEGSLGGAVIRIFENKYKKKDTDPDDVMYISQRPKPDDRVQQYRREQTNAPQVQGRVAPRPQGAGPITPRPQAQAAPPKPAYKDWTQQDSPPDDGAPWPTDDESMPF